MAQGEPSSFLYRHFTGQPLPQHLFPYTAALFVLGLEHWAHCWLPSQPNSARDPLQHTHSWQAAVGWSLTAVLHKGCIVCGQRSCFMGSAGGVSCRRVQGASLIACSHYSVIWPNTRCRCQVGTKDALLALLALFSAKANHILPFSPSLQSL